MNDDHQPNEGPPDNPAIARSEMSSSQSDHPTEQITAPVTAPETTSGDATESNDWEKRYYRERSLARIFMATTAAAALLFTGTLAYAVASNPEGPGTETPTQISPDGRDPGDRRGPGQDGGFRERGGPKFGEFGTSPTATVNAMPSNSRGSLSS